MIEFVKARDGRCRFPGCTIDARFCDLDHVIAWPHGPTHPDNLACLCRRRPRVKQRPGWHAVLHPDATMTWTDPTGRTRTTAPEDHLQLDRASPSMPRPVGSRPTDAETETERAGAEDVSPKDARPDGAGAELPSLLEDGLEHAHDHQLIALACYPATLSWRNRRACTPEHASPPAPPRPSSMQPPATAPSPSTHAEPRSSTSPASTRARASFGRGRRRPDSTNHHPSDPNVRAE